MSDLLANPAIQSGALPLAVALCFAAVLGSSRASRLAGLAVAVGFGSAYVATFGWPPFPPNTSSQKILYIAVLAAVLGLCVDHWRVNFTRRVALTVGLVVLATVWVAWRKMWVAPSLDHVLALLVIGGGALAAYATGRTRKDLSDPIVTTLVVCLAFAGLAFLGASASIAQNAAAIGAALGGVMVLNWPTRRFGLSASARLVPVVILTALAAQVVFFTQAPAWALALLLPTLFADRITDRCVPADSPRTALVRPVILAIISILMVAPAIGAAWYISVSSAPGGGY